MNNVITQKPKLRIALISLHGLIRGENLELGRDADTGGQTRYVVELARALAQQPEVGDVMLMTRQIIDERVDSSYAQLEEEIGENVRIVRIPFGPRRYLYKESLWPFLDFFADQALAYFRRKGVLPDVIHGHYADAGFAGGQLARLLGIPFVFTGHSLGRVKRKQMKRVTQIMSGEEDPYAFDARIEAEEFALETASLVVASTHQEVESQYELYDHYVPERMEVIPPGVDLSLFHSAVATDRLIPYTASITRFLKDPTKPMILAMARPDERKNLEALVTAYGTSKDLQSMANLVLILGSRNDIAKMPVRQRKVMHALLTLIDTYDLYGCVAYPRTHQPDEVPDIYRIAALSHGVFINPAFTEPFGLTLLEAGASGLPIVATNDGGPRDILANCKNGLLIDPNDIQSIQNALMHVLSEPVQWEEWAKNGVSGTLEHYTWETHCRRYLRDVLEILKDWKHPEIIQNKSSRRIPDFDRLLIADIDNTLTGDAEGLKVFAELMRSADAHIGFGIATGRCFDEVMELLQATDLPQPDLWVTSVGTEIRYGKERMLDQSWRRQIDYNWSRARIEAVLATVEGLYMQSKKEQSQYKISYKIDPEIAPRISEIRKLLRMNGIRAKAILSLGIYLDVIPFRAGSGLSVRHIAYKWGISFDHILVAGDSGNDEGMLIGNTLGVVVANYSPELEKLRRKPRIYFAKAAHAMGVIEGIQHYDFFNHIRIPAE
jgi:sucrose-phosphate synthase